MPHNRIIQFLDRFIPNGVKVVFVSKYLSTTKTHQLYEAVKNHRCFMAMGENRIEKILEKQIPAQHMHMIGNLQSRDFKALVPKVSAIHSITKTDHIKKLAHAAIERTNPLDIFIQVNISHEDSKSGVEESVVPIIKAEIEKYGSLHLQGISALGSANFTNETKEKEFKMLCKIRDTYIKDGDISAGTSVDWKHAIVGNATILRLGTVITNMV